MGLNMNMKIQRAIAEKAERLFMNHLCELVPPDIYKDIASDFLEVIKLQRELAKEEVKEELKEKLICFIDGEDDE